MKRMFTQTVGRYERGEVRDWPLATWKMFKGWEKLTVAAGDDNIASLATALDRQPLRRKAKRHKVAEVSEETAA